MAKTFTSSLPAVSTGDVLTATAQNNLLTTVNSHTVPPMIRVRRNASQSIATATVAAVNFDTKDFDTDWSFTASSNILTVGTTGVYLLSATVSFQANATGGRGVTIYSGATVSGSGDSATVTGGTRVNGTFVPAVGGAIQTNVSCSGLCSLTAGDKIAVMAYQTSGGALNTNPSGYEETTFSAVFVGKTS